MSAAAVAALDSALVARTSRFVSSTSAIKMAGLVDKETGAQLVALAKSVRQFCDAHDYRLARTTLDRVEELVAAEGVTDQDVQNAIKTHVARIRERI